MQLRIVLANGGVASVTKSITLSCARGSAETIALHRQKVKKLPHNVNRKAKDKCFATNSEGICVWERSEREDAIAYFV